MPNQDVFRALPDADPIWRRVTREVRERLHPPPAPDLKLESQPVPVKSIWSEPRSVSRRLGSVALHLAVIGILMLPFWRPVHTAVQKAVTTTLVEPTLFAPGPSLPKMKKLAGGAPPVHRIVRPRMLQLKAPPMHQLPQLPLMPATTAANLPLASLGDIGSVAAAPGNTIGNGGPGPGGAGSGNGGGDCVSGVCQVGGDVSGPIPIYEPDPEYSDAARQAKVQGTVIVGVVIGTDGRVHDPRIVRALGLGLDEKALQAVSLWRFKPARKDGQPVRVAANIEVNFHLY